MTARILLERRTCRQEICRSHSADHLSSGRPEADRGRRGPERNRRLPRPQRQRHAVVSEMAAVVGEFLRGEAAFKDIATLLKPSLPALEKETDPTFRAALRRVCVEFGLPVPGGLAGVLADTSVSGEKRAELLAKAK